MTAAKSSAAQNDLDLAYRIHRHWVVLPEIDPLRRISAIHRISGVRIHLCCAAYDWKPYYYGGQGPYKPWVVTIDGEPFVAFGAGPEPVWQNGTESQHVDAR